MSRFSFVRTSLRGATFTEYLVIVGGIALLAVGAFAQFGDGNRKQMANISQELAGTSSTGQFGPGSSVSPPANFGTGSNFSGGAWGGSGSAGIGSGGTGGNTGSGAGGGSGTTPGAGSGGGGGTGSDPGAGLGGDWTDLLRPPGSPRPGLIGNLTDPANGAGGAVCQVPGSNAATFSFLGNPINLATGNKHQSETDYQGVGEFPLSLVRAYNSHLTDDRTALGPGWQHNYDRRITLQEGGVLRISRADGRRHLFRHDGQHWVTTDGNVDQLIEERQDDQRLGWRYLPGTGGAEHYDAQGRLQRIIHPQGQEHQLSYNEQGQLDRVTDAYGQQLRFYYQGPNLARVDSPDGQQYRYSFDDLHGTLLSVSQRTAGLRARLGLGQDSSRQYHYEDSQHTGYLTGITDESGVRYATWAYDHLGRAILSEHGQGVERIELEYLAGKTRVTNAAGLIATYHLVDIHGIKRVSRIEGDATPYCPESRQQHLYADTGFLAAAIDGEGNATFMRRDERGLILEEIRGGRWEDERALLQPESLRITREWHRELPLVIRETHYHRSIDNAWQAQHEQFNQYDQRGRLTLHTRINLSDQQQPYANHGVSRTWTYQYQYHDAEQTKLAQIRISDPRQQGQDNPRFSQIDYDQRGQLIRSTNVLGHRTRYSHHHANGRPGRILDPNGLETRLHYNAQGQLARIERRGEHTSEIAIDYLANGLPNGLQLESGLHLRVEYNDARQIVGLLNGQGERIAITPNAVSGSWEQLSIHDRDGQTTQQQQRQHDELGRVIAVLGNAGQQTRVHHDKVGNPVRIDQASDQEPSGLLSTVQHYDSLRRLTQHIDPAQGETQLSYNIQGRVTQVVAANDARTTYTYDGLGQLLQEHSPDTGTRVHHYDSAGQRIKSHSLGQPEQAIHYHYDLLGRLTRIQHLDPSDDIYYQYDQRGQHGAGIGRLTSVIDRHSHIDYRYDRHGNLLSDSRTLQIDGQTHVQRIEYHYSRGNQLAGITYPNGQRVDYHHQHGLPSSVSLQHGKQHQPLLSDIQHRPFGPMAQWTYGNGLTQRLTHDLDGRISAITVTDVNNQAVWQQHYQYDRLNNITGIERSEKEKTYQQQFGYDLVQRLIRDQGPYGEQQFEYDSVGNRLSHVQRQHDNVEEQRNEYHYVPASNRLIGSQAENGAQSDYRYNAHNRISEYYEQGQLKARYHYNALGQRIHKAVIQSDGTQQHTLFYYGLQGELLGETQLHANQPGQTQNIVWLQMRPVAALDSSEQDATPQIAWLHSDHLLTARAATDADQNLIWRWHSDAFGVGEAESLATVSPEAQSLILNLRFPGQYFDEESGLYYNYFRTYDPSMGRYTQSDPIGLLGGINTFAYVEGNPVQWADPLGLARLQYILIDNFGGSPSNAATNTLGAGVDPRLQHFAFYLTDIANAPGHSLIYDPNGTFGGLNSEGAVAWDATQAGSDPWASFQEHYAGRGMVTGSWATINNFNDAEAANLFEALGGYNPLGTQSSGCKSSEAAVRILPDLPQGFYDFENFSFPTYVHFLEQPIFFADQVPSADDPRYVDPDKLPWGKLTFEQEGHDFAGRASYSRVPHVPPSPSGVTIGRGFDLGQHTAAEIRNGLLRIGFPVGNDFNLLVGAAGLTGTDASNYYNANRQALDNVELTREQQYLLFLQSYKRAHDQTGALYLTHIQGGAGPAWSDLHVSIRDVLIDMRFRGDFRYVSVGNSRNHPQLSADFRNAVTQNDPAALCRVFSDNSARWEQKHTAGDDTSGWGVPNRRFLGRGVELGGTAVGTQLHCP